MWSNTDLEGQLTKQGHVVKNWKARWFSLQHNKMFYFKSRPNKWITKPTGSIFLQGATVRLDKDKFSSRPNCIEIYEPGANKVRRIFIQFLTYSKFWYLSAQTPDDINAWYHAIKTATMKKGNLYVRSFTLSYNSSLCMY